MPFTDVGEVVFLAHT